MHKLGSCYESVAVTVTDGLTADPAVEAVNLAARELTAALVLLNKLPASTKPLDIRMLR
jgi:hypothetical protein